MVICPYVLFIKQPHICQRRLEPCSSCHHCVHQHMLSGRVCRLHSRRTASARYVICSLAGLLQMMCVQCGCANNSVVFTSSAPACTLLRCWRKSTFFVIAFVGFGGRLPTRTVCPLRALLALKIVCKQRPATCCTLCSAKHGTYVGS